MLKELEKIEIGGLEIAVGDSIVAKGFRLNDANLGDSIQYKIKVEKIRQLPTLYQQEYGDTVGYYVRGKAGVEGLTLYDTDGKLEGYKLSKRQFPLAEIEQVVKL